ncbi:hypothetical protein RDI58_021577 [Solanum bulbocastanum]|uniref:Uncharacterized protein n=1 Tax=Solanum bulbocastanum TaxID=147425 RepID=A0AAN8T7W6_SOLBU
MSLCEQGVPRRRGRSSGSSAFNHGGVPLHIFNNFNSCGSIYVALDVPLYNNGRCALDV